jgi:lysophospholipase L1-like esterase
MLNLPAVALLAVNTFVHAHAGLPNQPVRILLVGDSTMATASGYGDALCARFAPDVTCVNLAKGGRSTKSYRAEGSWDKVLDLLADRSAYRASYVLVQFGHNDQPGKAERSTSLLDFAANLESYVNEIRGAGAVPILVTPLTRRSFEDGQLTRGLAPRAAVTRDVSAKTHVPLLDLYRDSVKRVEELGPEQSLELAEVRPPADAIAAAHEGTTLDVPKPATSAAGGSSHGHKPVFDYTHLGPKGAEIFSAIVAREIRDIVPALRPHLR